MINDLKENSNKQMNGIKKTIQDLNKKVNKSNEKFSKHQL
jgi:hypothetical protein